MALADVVDESQVPESHVWDTEGGSRDALKHKMNELKERSQKRLKDQGFDDESIEYEEYLNLRSW